MIKKLSSAAKKIFTAAVLLFAVATTAVAQEKDVFAEAAKTSATQMK